jgi:alpha-galactosidase
MPNITFIGAGSTVFAKNLLGDIWRTPALQDAHIRLFDIDERRLQLSERVARRLADALGIQPHMTVTTDRERALDGADYALNMIQVGGYKPSTVLDFEIPKRYGLQQTIGDTLGIGGIMRALRTVPVLLEMQRDMERLCPDVWHLNYVNPMAMIVWALRRASPIKTVGLCHSVQGTARELARDLALPSAEITYQAAGINHMAFYTKLQHNGEDLYPQLLELANSRRVPEHNRVRYEVLKHFGYFVTESSEHFAEYVPWFIKRQQPELLEQFNIPLDEYLGRCQVYEVAWDFIERELDHPGSQTPEDLQRALQDAHIKVMPGSIAHTVEDFRKLHDISQASRSIEYAATIINSIETGEPSVIYGNVPNGGLIDNLPRDACVEVPCLVDDNGVQPTQVGTLPHHLAALMQTNINVQRLTVEACLTGKREHVYHAAMLDPHTAAELTLEQIHHLVDDLLTAHGDLIPETLRPDLRPDVNITA